MCAGMYLYHIFHTGIAEFCVIIYLPQSLKLFPLAEYVY
jgi:hypothetical protein